MAIYLQQGDPNLMQGLSMLGQGLGKYQKRQQEKSIWEKVFDQIPETPSNMDIIKASMRAIKAGIEPDQASKIISSLGANRRGLTPVNTSVLQESLKNTSLSDEEKNMLITTLEAAPTVGAQTDAYKNFLDRLFRNLGIDGELQDLYEDDVDWQESGQLSMSTGQPQQDAVDNQRQPKPDSRETKYRKEKNLRSRFIKSNFRDTTPKDRIRIKELNRESNETVRSDVAEKTRTLEETNRALNRMSQINESGVLPGMLGREFIIKEDGNIRLPELFDESGEIQEYIKITNGFLKNAKTYFGARITNFDLDAFKQMLPTLANSASGRRLIINTMRIQNEIEKTLQDSIKQTYDDLGTSQYTRSQIEQIAEERVADKLDKLKAENEEKGIGGKIPVVHPDGTEGLIPADFLEDAIAQGYTVQ